MNLLENIATNEIREDFSKAQTEDVTSHRRVVYKPKASSYISVGVNIEEEPVRIALCQ